MYSGASKGSSANRWWRVQLTSSATGDADTKQNPPTTVQVGGRTHTPKLDGCVEEFIPETVAGIRSLSNLKPIFTSPTIQGVQRSLAEDGPADHGLRVTPGSGEKELSNWNLFIPADSDTIQLRRNDDRGETFVEFSGNDFVLHVTPGGVVRDVPLTQRITGRFNPANGTITCLEECIAGIERNPKVDR